MGYTALIIVKTVKTVIRAVFRVWISGVKIEIYN